MTPVNPADYVTMWDAVNVPAIVANADVLGVYVDPPPYINTVRQAFDHFPHADIVTITAIGTAGARIGDSEKGNMDPPALAQWDRREIDAGRRPTNYCSLSAVGAVVAALDALRIHPGAVDWFPADWTGTPHLADLSKYGVTAVGTQYANPATTGGDFDMSIVSRAWLGLAPTPGPVGPPIRGDDSMHAVTLPDGTVKVYAIGAGNRAGQLLEFTRTPSDPTRNAVIDVTDQVGGNDPYTVSA
jgi:hypothetical protein